MPSRPSTSSSSSESSRDKVDRAGSAVDDVMDGEVKDSDQRTGLSIPILPTILCLGILISLHYHFAHKEAKMVATYHGPRLVHVVNEIQGFRKINLIGLAVMVLTGVGLLGTMILYRRQRVQLARRHDAIFWMLSSWSLALGVVFTIQRWRRRRQLAAQRSYRAFWRTPEKILTYLTFTLPIIPLACCGCLLWYRRRQHLRHLERRRQRKIKKREAIQKQDVI